MNTIGQRMQRNAVWLMKLGAKTSPNTFWCVGGGRVNKIKSRSLHSLEVSTKVKLGKQRPYQGMNGIHYSTCIS